MGALAQSDPIVILAIDIENQCKKMKLIFGVLLIFVTGRVRKIKMVLLQYKVLSKTRAHNLMNEVMNEKYILLFRYCTYIKEKEILYIRFCIHEIPQRNILYPINLIITIKE
jgi:hypothetical protein